MILNWLRQLLTVQEPPEAIPAWAWNGPPALLAAWATAERKIAEKAKEQERLVLLREIHDAVTGSESGRR